MSGAYKVMVSVKKVGQLYVTIIPIARLGGLAPTRPIKRYYSSEALYMTVCSVTSVPGMNPLLLSTWDVPTPDHGRSSLLDPTGINVSNLTCSLTLTNKWLFLPCLQVLLYMYMYMYSTAN